MAEGKKSRKFGRNSTFCTAYRSSAIEEQNQLRRLLRHVKRTGKRTKGWQEAYNRINARLGNTTMQRIYRELHVDWNENSLQRAG